ncbi:hypothetical protein K502DRAFT_323274 [Neoconidiobolus thromboides FSU 785]|nr:hypothetical protein K502DRAFT_323274 [Neoconidiobolus thromboides FSU 785]
MIELNTFTGRGLCELPLGIIAYLFPSYLPIKGLDLDNVATLFLVRSFGVAVCAISLLSIYTGHVDEKSTLRKQVALVLMGYSSMMITLLLNSKDLITFNLIKHIPAEVTMVLIHGMFCYEFYQIVNLGNYTTTGTAGVTID